MQGVNLNNINNDALVQHNNQQSSAKGQKATNSSATQSKLDTYEAASFHQAIKQHKVSNAEMQTQAEKMATLKAQIASGTHPMQSKDLSVRLEISESSAKSFLAQEQSLGLLDS